MGVALLLAAFSYHYDQAQRKQRPLRRQLGASAFSLAAWIAFALIGVGLVATSTQLWEQLIWVAFSLYAAISAIRQWRAGSHSSPPVANEE